MDRPRNGSWSRHIRNQDLVLIVVAGAIIILQILLQQTICLLMCWWSFGSNFFAILGWSRAAFHTHLTAQDVNYPDHCCFKGWKYPKTAQRWPQCCSTQDMPRNWIWQSTKHHQMWSEPSRSDIWVYLMLIWCMDSSISAQISCECLLADLRSENA